MNTSFLQFRSRRRKGAFTIIELVVAIGVTAMLVTIMLYVTVNMLSNWNRTSGVLNTSNQARFIINQLTLDLQNSLRADGPETTFVVTIQNNQSTVGDADVARADWPLADIKPRSTGTHPTDSLIVNFVAAEDRNISDYRFGQAGVWLRFFANTVDGEDDELVNVSAPRAVSYQIVRRQRENNANAEYSYQLFRSEVRPFGNAAPAQARSTFGVGYDLLGDNAYNDKGSGITADEDPVRIRRPGLESLIGEGVVDFGVRIFSREVGGQLIETFPVDRRVGNTDASIRLSFVNSTVLDKVPAFVTTSLNPTAAETSYGRPAVVEVMLRILTPEGIQTIQAYENDPSRFGGSSPDKWWELVIQNSNVYTQRITL